MQWSVDGQIPEFLAATRMATLSRDVVSQILQHLNLKPGMKVLDLGCGSGEYTFRLGLQTEGVEYIGVDLDSNFVRIANERAAGSKNGLFEQVSNANTYAFICADGCNLPFEDATFDAVVSHTYLTAVPDYMAALAEMCRVCKPAGQVSSVTCMDNNFGGIGRVDLLPRIMPAADAALSQKIHEFMAKATPFMDLTSGIPPYKPQRAFAWIGLEKVGAFPLGQYFCLSDVRTTPKDYERYVELLYAMELRGIKRIKEAPEIDMEITAQEWESYEGLLSRRREQLLSLNGCNTEWDWFGSAALLVWGNKPEDGEMPVVQRMLEGVHVSEAAHKRLEGVDNVHERWRQAGPGRCCKVRLFVSEAEVEDEDTPTFDAWGIDPPHALEEAASMLLGDADAQRAAEVEKRAEKALEGDADSWMLTPIDDKEVFSLELVWETVAEVAEYGYGMHFKELTAEQFDSQGLHVVACELEHAVNPFRAICAHAELSEAIARACARAIGKGF